MALELNRSLPEGWTAQSYTVPTEDLLEINKVREKALKLMIFVILAIAATGIANTIIMSVYERVREVGTLAAMGMPPHMIRALFVIEGAIMGFWAALLGAGLGQDQSLLRDARIRCGESSRRQQSRPFFHHHLHGLLHADDFCGHALWGHSGRIGKPVACSLCFPLGSSGGREGRLMGWILALSMRNVFRNKRRSLLTTLTVVLGTPCLLLVFPGSME